MGKNHRIRLSALTKTELNKIFEEANFTIDQEKIFRAMNADTHYDFAVMSDLGLSPRKYYELKSIVVEKCVRISIQLGLYDAIKLKE